MENGVREQAADDNDPQQSKTPAGATTTAVVTHL